MAIPVKFGDIGKSASDLLKADYSPFSLEVNSQTVNGVKFTANVKKSDATKSDFTGDLKAKYFDAANGVTFNYSFSTDKKLTAKAEVADTLIKGLRVDAEASIKADTASKGVKIGLGFKEPHINTNASIDVLNDKLPVSFDAVVGYEGFNLGGETTYEAGKGTVAAVKLAASFAQPDYAFAVHAVGGGRFDFNSVSASYYHQVNNQLAAAAKVSYDLQKSNTTLAVGTNYAVDSSSSLKTTLDTNGKLLFQYTQKLRPNVKATFGTTLKWDNTLTADTGLSFVFDA